MHSMHDCIEKYEKELIKKNGNNSIEILTDTAWSVVDESCKRELSITIEFNKINKNGDFCKKVKKAKLFMEYCPFCGAKNK